MTVNRAAAADCMFRSTVAHHHLCKRLYSTSSNVQTRKKLSPLGAASILGFGALTSLYFFYPDTSRSAPTLGDQKLAPSHFTPCTITCSEPSGLNTRLITLSIPPQLLPKEQSSFSAIWSIFIKDDDIQVERPYTPLEGVDSEGKMKFWIKKYPKGEVGRWLHSKKVGESIEIRGPLQTWLWKDDDVWDQVVMISGGTGIAPFYQLFHETISQGVSPKTRFTLLHSSRSPSELPPGEILKPLSEYALEHPKRFQLKLFVDTLDSKADEGLCLNEGRISKSALEPSSRRWIWPFRKTAEVHLRKTLFLVCGPEPMVAAIAGPYGRNSSQGRVGGILAELGATSSQVYKL